ncbi:MAG: cytochrome c oxidase subunit II [Hyphomicrobiaceae bacterium]
MTALNAAAALWRMLRTTGFGGMALLAALVAGVAPAWASQGMATDYQLGLPQPGSDIAAQIHDFHTGLMWLITIITIFVLVLLLIVMFKFNSRANPTPSHTHHNTLIEVIWTVVPIIILVIVAIPSFRLLFNQYDLPKPDVTIKAIGNQWYWSYEYADQEGVGFDSFMLSDADIEKRKAGGELLPRLLAVDNEVVVPVNAVVHVIVTSRDVIHNWTVQPLGSKVDAVPGRLTSTWFKANESGVYYGQCSELCGKDHAFMPIAVRVVDKAVFDQWVALRKTGGSDVDDKARALIRSAATQDGAAAKTVASAD